MKRWHEELFKMKQQRHVCSDNDNPLGKFRKKHALDCGKSRCFICHSDKILHIKSKKEILADLKTKEQIDEIEH